MNRRTDAPTHRPTTQLDRETARINRMTRLGMAGNIGLAILKFAVGKLSGSLALIADGFNSLTDVITDIAVLIGTGLGSRPADQSHPYGHGKLETFVAGLVAFGVLGVGGGIIWSAVQSFITERRTPHGGMVIAAALVTIVVKELLFRRTKRVAVECRSAALTAKAWDHRSDVLVSGMVLAGGVGALLKWPYADGVAGLAVGLVIMAVGGRLIFETLAELSEGSAGAEAQERIESVFREFNEIQGWHRLRVRRLGRELVADVHIVLDGQLTVGEGHAIVQRIEDTVMTRLQWPINLVIHVDPEGIHD